MMNHDIFISYSSKQKSIADGVCHYLEENGFKCWMAPRDIPVGSDYGDLIEEAIKKSKAVVLVFSEAASVSNWVRGEINVAFSNNKPILPFRIDNTQLTGALNIMLNQMHWIDAFPHYADRLPDLLSSICGLLGKQPIEVNPPSVICPEGAINGIFSVSPTKKVYFSKGNLQYQASTGLWRFAEKQYDYVGRENNEKISRKNMDWIDLFGWGTGDEPENKAELNNKYRKFADWGNNRIINGGNRACLWHTLTQKEWEYVFDIRNTRSGVRFVKAQVNGINGVVLFSDEWCGASCELRNENNKEGEFVNNTISAQQWSDLEHCGTVFLPAAGDRAGVLVNGVGFFGYYWSASNFDGENACSVRFYESCLLTGNYHIDRYFGQSVRLVRLLE